MTPNPCPHCHGPRNRHGCPSCNNRHRRATRAHLDQLAIDAAINTRRPTPGLRHREQRAVSAQLTALGLPAHEIARICGVTPRTIHRWRAQVRAAQADAEHAPC